MNKTDKDTKKFWTFATQVPFEVKEQLDNLSRAEYKKLVEKIRKELKEAGEAASKEAAK